MATNANLAYVSCNCELFAIIIWLTAQGFAMGLAFFGRENSIEPGCEIVGFFFWWQRAGKSDDE
jgi:hypothetical protein